MDIAKFFVDWVPPLGILAGGVFALFKWRHEERLRSTREIPSLDQGILKVSAFALDNSRTWLQLDATWRNPGKIPFDVDTDSTRIDVYPIPPDLPFGPLYLRKEKATDLGEPTFTLYPLAGFKYFRVEPGAESILQGHFVLPRDSVVLFRFKVFRINDEGRKLSRTRFLIFNPHNLTTSTSNEVAR